MIEARVEGRKVFLNAGDLVLWLQRVSVTDGSVTERALQAVVAQIGVFANDARLKAEEAWR